MTAVALTANGKLLAAASSDNMVKAWDVAAGKERATFYPQPPTEGFTALSADGKTVASNGVEQRERKAVGTVDVWAVESPAMQNAADPPKEDAGTDIEKLAQARVDAAHKAYDVAVKLVRDRSPGVRPEDVYTWSVRWLNAQRDLSSKKEDHQSALSEHFKRMQELAQVAGALTKAGQGSPLDSATADFYLREAELWLAQAKATAKQADK
jgi:WD40 repeat protein